VAKKHVTSPPPMEKSVRSALGSPTRHAHPSDVSIPWYLRRSEIGRAERVTHRTEGGAGVGSGPKARRTRSEVRTRPKSARRGRWQGSAKSEARGRGTKRRGWRRGGRRAAARGGAPRPRPPAAPGAPGALDRRARYAMGRGPKRARCLASLFCRWLFGSRRRALDVRAGAGAGAGAGARGRRVARWSGAPSGRHGRRRAGRRCRRARESRYETSKGFLGDAVRETEKRFFL